MDAIKTKKLSKTYVSGNFWVRKRSVALINVDLTVKEKQVFGLLGLNGAGKTTLMKILLGLVSPSSGKALVLGKDIREASNRKNIAYLPEMPYFPRYLTPREILTFYGRLYELSHKESKAKAAEALQTVGLYKRADSKLREFSKGMLQRVGISSLLLNDAKLFFLDEPTYGLDPPAGWFSFGKLRPLESGVTAPAWPSAVPITPPARPPANLIHCRGCLKITKVRVSVNKPSRPVRDTRRRLRTTIRRLCVRPAASIWRGIATIPTRRWCSASMPVRRCVRGRRAMPQPFSRTC